MANPVRNFDQVNVSDTLSRIARLRERRQVRQQEIADAIGIEKSKLSRWLNGKSSWASIGIENYGNILDFLAERGLFSESGYERPEAAGLMDIAFHSMTTFLGAEAADIDRARESLVGHYVGWRYSFFAPPDILKGKMDIDYDEETHALKTFEHYRVPAGVMGAESRQVNFMRAGYIWPTKQNLYAMVSRKVGGVDIQIAFLNKSMMSAITMEKGAMESIEGAILDCQGPDLYMTKLFLQKLERPLPDAEIGLRPEKDVPSGILAKLKERFVGPHHYLRVYR